MSDATSESGSGSGPKWGLVVGGLVVIALVVVGAFVFLGGDDDESSDTTIAGETTVETTAPETTVAPETTEASETTAAPQTTEAPATTEAPETTEAPASTAPETTAPATTEAPPTLDFTIAGIDDGGTIPTEFTCDGANTPPVLTIESIPEAVLGLALVVDDPDAPTDDPFVHWVVYNIPGNVSSITDGDPALTYGTNDADTEAWFGPCPPPGDGPHTYVFTLTALNRDLALEPGLDGRAVADAIVEATVDQTVVTATYERAG